MGRMWTDAPVRGRRCPFQVMFPSSAVVSSVQGIEPATMQSGETFRGLLAMKLVFRKVEG